MIMHYELCIDQKSIDLWAGDMTAFTVLCSPAIWGRDLIPLRYDKKSPLYQKAAPERPKHSDAAFFHFHHHLCFAIPLSQPYPT